IVGQVAMASKRRVSRQHSHFDRRHRDGAIRQSRQLRRQNDALLRDLLAFFIIERHLADLNTWRLQGGLARGTRQQCGGRRHHRQGRAKTDPLACHALISQKATPSLYSLQKRATGAVRSCGLKNRLIGLFEKKETPPSMKKNRAPSTRRL